MRPMIMEVTKAGGAAMGKKPGWYYDDGGQTVGPFQLRSQAVEASRRNTPELAPGRAMVRDYRIGAVTFGATAKWPDGHESNSYVMASSLEEAKKRFAETVNKGGWPKLTNIRSVQTRAPDKARDHWRRLKTIGLYGIYEGDGINGGEWMAVKGRGIATTFRSLAEAEAYAKSN